MSTIAISRRRVGACVGAMVCLMLTFGTRASNGQPAAKPLPEGAFADNVELVASSNLDGKPAFKATVQEVDGRWYMYVGHIWVRGWGILDVTDPSDPKYLKFIPGPDNTSTLQLDWAGNGRLLTPLSRLLRGRGLDESKPNEGGFYVWDLTDPVDPKRLGQYKSLGTHRNYYDGGRYVYAASREEGFEGNILVIVDVSDPANPVEVSRWWAPGQHVAGGETSERGLSLHGPPDKVGNLLYLPYGGAGLVVLDISDIEKPTLVGQLDFSPPFPAGLGLHTVLPVPDRNGRKYVFVNSEAGYGCGPDAMAGGNFGEPEAVIQLTGIVDVTDPKDMFMVSALPRPFPPPDYPFADFCDHGEYGPHNANNIQWNPFIEEQGDLLYLTWQVGGLHIFDIADPRAPKEVGYFVAPDPTKRLGSIPPGPVLNAVTENMLVDARHYIYIFDRNDPWEMMVLRYTGPKSPWRTAN